MTATRIILFSVLGYLMVQSVCKFFENTPTNQIKNTDSHEKENLYNKTELNPSADELDIIDKDNDDGGVESEEAI